MDLEVLLPLLGSMSLAAAAWSAVRYLRVLRWPTVEGEVVSCDAFAAAVPGTWIYLVSARVFYELSVRYSVHGVWHELEATRKKEVAGRTITVSYNPQDHRQAVLIQPFPWHALLLGLFGASAFLASG